MHRLEKKLRQEMQPTFAVLQKFDTFHRFLERNDLAGANQKDICDVFSADDCRYSVDTGNVSAAVTGNTYGNLAAFFPDLVVDDRAQAEHSQIDALLAAAHSSRFQDLCDLSQELIPYHNPTGEGLVKVNGSLLSPTAHEGVACNGAFERAYRVATNILDVLRDEAAQYLREDDSLYFTSLHLCSAAMNTMLHTIKKQRCVNILNEELAHLVKRTAGPQRMTWLAAQITHGFTYEELTAEHASLRVRRLRALSRVSRSFANAYALYGPRLDALLRGDPSDVITIKWEDQVVYAARDTSLFTDLVDRVDEKEPAKVLMKLNEQPLRESAPLLESCEEQFDFAQAFWHFFPLAKGLPVNVATYDAHVEDVLSWPLEEQKAYAQSLKNAKLGKRIPAELSSEEMTSFVQIALRDLVIYRNTRGAIPSSKVIKELVGAVREEFLK